MRDILFWRDILCCWLLFFLNKFLFRLCQALNFLKFNFFAYKIALIGKKSVLYLNKKVFPEKHITWKNLLEHATGAG